LLPFPFAIPPPPPSPLFPYTTLFRSRPIRDAHHAVARMGLRARRAYLARLRVDVALRERERDRHLDPGAGEQRAERAEGLRLRVDRKSTRLNSSHVKISYAVFCLKKK